jgi:hypothetical protein
MAYILVDINRKYRYTINMNKEIEKIAEQADILVTDELIYFYRLVGERCADMCGSQADQKSIRRHFGLDYRDGPTHFQDNRHLETQYDWSKHYIEEKK